MPEKPSLYRIIELHQAGSLILSPFSGACTNPDIQCRAGKAEGLLLSSFVQIPHSEEHSDSLPLWFRRCISKERQPRNTLEEKNPAAINHSAHRVPQTRTAGRSLRPTHFEAVFLLFLIVQFIKRRLNKRLFALYPFLPIRFQISALQNQVGILILVFE